MIWIGLKGLLRLEREILILIHQYINNGYHIVLDVNSGSVHVVDPVVYDAIAAVSEQVPEMDKPEKLSEEVTANVHKKLDETYGSEMVCEALEDIQELIDTEQLLTRDIYRDFVLDFKKHGGHDTLLLPQSSNDRQGCSRVQYADRALLQRSCAS